MGGLMLFRRWLGVHGRFRWLRRIGGVQAGGQGFDQKVDDFPGGGTVGVFVGIELRDVEAEQVFVSGEFFEGVADLGVREATAGRDVYGGKVVAGNYVEVEVQDEVAS